MTTNSTHPSKGNVWDWMLRLGAIAIAASGLFFVVFGAVTAALFKRLIYGSAANPIIGHEAMGYARFVYGVLGAVMFGWSLALWCLIVGPLRHRERWAWQAVGFSLAGWFTVDTMLSIVSGYGENAILNAVFGVLFAVPLIGMRKDIPTAPSHR